MLDATEISDKILDEIAMIKIFTYSGDSYEVPVDQKHEIEDYRAHVAVIKRNRISPVSIDEYKVALAGMMKYETGETGWRYSP